MSKPKRSLGKRLRNSKLVLWPIVVLVYLLLRLLYLTNRKTHQWPAELQCYARGEKPAIYCFWHGRMIAQLFIMPPKRRMYVFSSPSRDGLIASMLTRCFGIRTVYGSRSKGASAAAASTRALLQVAQEGNNISITPDGPRGPFQKAAPGAAYLASRSGHPLIPVTFAASRHKRFRSWDKFMLFMPFGRVYHLAGAPITVPPDADEATLARITEQLQQAMNRLTENADGLAGVHA